MVLGKVLFVWGSVYYSCLGIRGGSGDEFWVYKFLFYYVRLF